MHKGFFDSLNSISDTVRSELKTALAEYPDYRTTISGYSLGGALAEFAFGSLKPQSFNVTNLFTYGAPRIGTQGYADYVDSLSGVSDSDPGIYYRVTHADGKS